MKLSDLERFFGKLGRFVLRSNEPMQSDAFSDGDVIHVVSSGDRIFAICVERNGRYDNVLYHFSVDTAAESNKLEDCIRGRYLARVDKVKSGLITIEVLKTPSLDVSNEQIEIACSDSKLIQLSVRGSDLYESYCYEHGSRAYFVLGRVDKSQSKKDATDELDEVEEAENDPNASLEKRTEKSNFTICGKSGRIDVNIARRKEIGNQALLPGEELDEVFYAKGETKRPANKSKYVYAISGRRYVFKDYTKAAVARRAQQIVLKETDGLGRYLSLWKKYNQMERRYIETIFDQAGTLHAEIVSDPRSDGKTLFRFNVLGRHQDFVRFATGLETIGKENGITITTVINQKERSYDAEVDSYPAATSTEQYFFLRISNPRFSIATAQKVTLSLAKKAFDIMFDRREKAIDCIAKGESANPELALIISGKSQPRPVPSRKMLTLTPSISRQTFGISGPTLSQRKAIEAAINTPDIAIIQGPPGTGKSTVIQAIESILSTSGNNKKSYFGKNLVTAYQNDAVDNVAAKLTSLYGFPVIAFMRRDSSDTSDARKRQWVESLTRNLQVRNPNSVALAYAKASYCRFLRHKQSFNPNIFTYDDDLGFLMVLRDLLIQDAQVERSDRLSSFLQGSDAELIAFMSEGQIDELISIAHERDVDTIRDFFNGREAIWQNHDDSEIEILKKEGDSTFRMLRFLADGNLVNEAQRAELSRLIYVAEKEAGKTSGLNYNRYYASLWNLPLSNTVYQDNGASVVAGTIYQLKNLNTSFYKDHKKEIDKLESLYAANTIDYPSISKIVWHLMSAIVPSPAYSVPKEFNYEIERFLESISCDDPSADPVDQEIANFIIALRGNESEVAQSIAEFSTTIVATHQRVDSKDVVMQKEKTENKNYENVIVDEAARSAPPDLLIPLVLAQKKIILVGDQNQLPQLINEDIYNQMDESDAHAAEKALLKKSMFEHLIDICLKYEKMDGMTRVVRLNEQFRMPKTLGDFIGRNFYSTDVSGKAISGTPLITCTRKNSHPIGISELNNCAMGFVDCPGEHEAQDYTKSKYRKEEAQQIALRLKKYFEESNFLKNQAPTFAVMAFYKRQIEEIFIELEKVGIAGKNGSNQFEIKGEYASRIMVGTVDSFQGRQYDIVMVSMTRNPNASKNGKKAGFGFLRSMNRQCVALSRAKRCCLLFASRDAFSNETSKAQIPALYDFYQMCVNKEAPDAMEL